MAEVKLEMRVVRIGYGDAARWKRCDRRCQPPLLPRTRPWPPTSTTTTARQPAGRLPLIGQGMNQYSSTKWRRERNGILFNNTKSSTVTGTGVCK